MQSHLSWDPSITTTLFLGSILFPTEQYSSSITVFPGQNAYPWYEMEAQFALAVTIFSQGKIVLRAKSNSCDEEGYLSINFDSFLPANRGNIEGLMYIELYQTKKVPVDLYISAVHRKTGHYFSYPALVFMGDKIFVDLHADQMENTSIWPGLAVNESTEVFMAVINPYQIAAQFQVHLFLESGERLQSKPIKISRRGCRLISLNSLFADHTPNGIESKTGSVCVASQYKHLSYGIIKDRTTGLVHSVDHTHNYQIL